MGPRDILDDCSILGILSNPFKATLRERILTTQDYEVNGLLHDLEGGEKEEVAF